MVSREDHWSLPPISQCLQTTDYVKVYVGPERKMWFINEEFLCTRLDYFRAAFRSGGGGFQEGAEKSIHLVEEDPGAFGSLMEWIHTEHRCGALGFSTCFRDEDADDLFKLCLLVEKLGCTSLRDEILAYAGRLADAKLGEELSAEMYEVIYRQTVKGSPIRSMVVENGVKEFFRKMGTESRLSHEATNCPDFNKEFLEAIATHLLEGVNQCSLDPCNTHDRNTNRGGWGWGDTQS